MSWGTYYTQEVEIRRKSFNSKGELEYSIEELEKDIARYKADLLALACCTPKDIVVDKDSCDTALDAVKREFNNTFELLEEDMLELYKEKGLLENWETKKEW